MYLHPPNKFKIYNMTIARFLLHVIACAFCSLRLFFFFGFSCQRLLNYSKCILASGHLINISVWILKLCATRYWIYRVNVLTVHYGMLVYTCICWRKLVRIYIIPHKKRWIFDFLFWSIDIWLVGFLHFKLWSLC